MDNYHIFAIKNEVYNIYKDNTHSLFKLLYNLYNLNKTDLNYGITLYNQICNTINTKKLEKYIKLIDNKQIKNKYIIINNKQYSIIIIKPSNIIYKTNRINKNITYVLNSYYNYLFLCNFDKKEYNWLNKY